MRELPLDISVSGDNLQDLFRAVLADPVFGAGTPERVNAGSDVIDVTEAWVDEALGRAKIDLFVRFDDVRWVSLKVDRCVKAGAACKLDVEYLLALIRRLPCTLVSIDGVYPSWIGNDELKLPLRGFGNFHFPFRNLAAFKGDGHRRVVSRRWLDFGGPWKVHRGDGDLALLQLHDLDADAATAHAQAAASIDRLGPSDTGRVYQVGFERRLELKLQYSERDKTASIVVANRELSPREMLEAASLRGSAVAGPDSPIEHVSFVYIDEAQARRDLPELWLRELQCWAYVRGREVRLDDSYEPTPYPRSW